MLKIGDKVIGRNILGKGSLPLIVIEDKGDGWYQCRIEDTEVSMPYHEDELERSMSDTDKTLN